VHPAWVVPGGVNKPLSVEKVQTLLKQIPGAIEIAQQSLSWFKRELETIKAKRNITTNECWPSLPKLPNLVARQGALRWSGDKDILSSQTNGERRPKGRAGRSHLRSQCQVNLTGNARPFLVTHGAPFALS
jgi:hypothetical protein